MNLPSYQKFTEKREEIDQCENSLLSLHKEKRDLEAEYDKMPQVDKTKQQRDRKKFVEERLDLIAKEIAREKRNLRDFGLLE